MAKVRPVDSDEFAAVAENSINTNFATAAEVSKLEWEQGLKPMDLPLGIKFSDAPTLRANALEYIKQSFDSGRRIVELNKGELVQ